MGDNGEIVGRVELRMGKDKGRRGRRGDKKRRKRKKGMRKGESRSNKIGDRRKGTQDKDARV